MQRHKELYKEQSLVLSPRNHCKENRDRLQAARAKKREDCFYQNRIISVSPTPVKAKPFVAAQENVAPKLENQEQLQLDNKPAEQPMESKLKASRQKLYLQRYMEWKKVKSKEHEQQDQKRRGAPINAPTINQSKVLPKSQTFRFPETLASAKQKEEAAPVFQPSKRCSLYVIANPTGKGKATEPVKPSIPQATSSKSVAFARQKSAASETKIFPPIRHDNNPVASARQKAAARPLPNTTTQTTSWRPRQPAIEPKKTTTIPKPAPAAVKKAKATSVRQQAPKPKLPAQVAPLLQVAPRTGRLANVLSQPFVKPSANRAPVARHANVVKPQPIRGGGGAAAKFKDSAGATSKAAGHSIRMKAIKPNSQYTRLQNNVRKLPQLKVELLQAATLGIPPHTPLDEIHNPFIDQATSTQCKSNNSSCHLVETFGDSILLSPVAPVRAEGDSSVKRKLLPADKNVAGKKDASVPVAKKKFDFTRYSVTNSPAEDSLILEPEQTTIIEDTLVPEETTPPRRKSNGMPNYLSPFVSVSRGKVNSRCEKEKRNSFYLSNEESSLEVRRAMESVLYFRLQLENEITRLQALCAEWEAYSKENEPRLQETGGIDMINVTIGQTRLLTTKKMMQFSSLIDRCEAGATGKNRQPNDGSEDSKPVQAEDLEGWWDMLRLQSDNVDKRFDNLKRWKANDWLDPDAIAEEPKQAEPMPKPKTSRNMKIKSKAKPSSNLQQFLRKAHANMKKTKVEEPALEDGLPSTSSRRSSPRVIVVRNRRSFSPARTVLRMSNGEGRQSIAPNALLKSAILAAAEQNAAKTPPPKPRASILKTPGTTKRQNRGVLFSAKKSVRRFQFTYEEGNISDDETVGADQLEDCEEDMFLEASTESRSLEQNPGAGQENGGTPRTYTLRNRRVNLRPSSEFM